MKKKINKDLFSLQRMGYLNKFSVTVQRFSESIVQHKKRIIFFSLVTWFPLLILTALSGVAFSGVEVPFLYDIEVHVRLLLVLSILIYIEVLVYKRLQIIVEQFLKCAIITKNELSKFNQYIASATRLRSSLIVKLALIIAVFTIGHWISTRYLSLGISSWYSINSNGISKLTPAGYWYIFVSLPIFQFVLLLWYFHIIVWYQFLWKISRLPLQLNSLHPDHAGGLGFLAESVYALGPFLVAHSVLLLGMIINRIWNTGATLTEFQVEIISILIFVIMIPLIPLFFFMGQMIKEKRIGTLKFAATANRCVNSFREKWIINESKNLLEASDVQSLADLANSFEVTSKMRVLPFGKNHIIALLILVTVPLIPLLLTMIPLEKMISQIFGLIF